MSKTWTKAFIVTQIKLLHSQGIALNSGSIRKTHSALQTAGFRKFGSWKKTIEAAGINYSTVSINVFKSKRETWSHKKVIDEINKLYEKKVELNARSAFINHSKLYSAACCYFGKWRNAIEVAGIELSEVAKRPDFIEWSKDLVVIKIKERNKVGHLMNSRTVELDNLPLWSAGCRYFNGWRNALLAADLDPKTIYLTKSWTLSSFCKEIRLLHTKNIDLSMVNMENLNRQDLLTAARKLFGGWKQALESLGFDYSTIRKKRRDYWNSDQVIKEISDLILEGERLNHGWVKVNHNALTHAALKFFGSWNGALEAVGLNHREHSKKWSMKDWLKKLTDEEYEGIIRNTITRKGER